MELEAILTKLGERSDGSEFDSVEPFDVLVISGSPTSAVAAIYAARKIRTGLVAERFSGQVNDTLAIENIIGTKATEGPAFAVHVARCFSTCTCSRKLL